MTSKIKSMAVKVIEDKNKTQWVCDADKNVRFSHAKCSEKQTIDFLTRIGLIKDTHPLESALNTVDEIDKRYKHEGGYFFDEVMLDVKRAMHTLVKEIEEKLL